MLSVNTERFSGRSLTAIFEVLKSCLSNSILHHLEANKIPLEVLV